MFEMDADTPEFDALNSLLHQRHSCRSFHSDPVSREVIVRILEIAQLTASWCNAQPWRVHILSGEPLEALRTELLARVDTKSIPAPDLDWPREYRGVYLERRRECGWSLYRATGVPKGDREASARQARENFRCFGAPHVAIVSSDEALGTHGVMDTGAWVANFMLAGQALGVASIAQAALASYPDVLRRHLDIAPDHRIVCGISFGFENADHPANGFRTSRAPLHEVVTWVD